MEREKLDKILENHKLWLNDKGGERADLSDTNLTTADLRGADLRNANLYGADLRGADLSDANLRNANLYGANLRNADLYSANLRYADLRYADLRYADLSGADLRYADLRYTDLSGADLSDTNLTTTDLRNTNLTNTDLRNTNLTNIKTNIYTVGYNLACPEEGSFIAYKKANDCIIKLLILEDSKRNSATTLKCRCDKAKVLDIEEIGTGEKIESTPSDYDINFIYKVGEIVKVEDFDENRWNECSTGIHFFMNKENAIQY